MDFVVMKVFLRHWKKNSKIEHGFSFHIIVVKLLVKTKFSKRQKMGKAFGNNT
jgi:hypothetical protein